MLSVFAAFAHFIEREIIQIFNGLATSMNYKIFLIRLFNKYHWDILQDRRDGIGKVLQLAIALSEKVHHSVLGLFPEAI